VLIGDSSTINSDYKYVLILAVIIGLLVLVFYYLYKKK
jgi:Mg2+ and Co2+ transporter CorA